MTPKEKAEELFTTYRFSLSIPNAPLGDLKDSIAKQCALISVDEIINIIDEDQFILYNYWQQVKQEIDKL